MKSQITISTICWVLSLCPYLTSVAEGQFDGSRESKPESFVTNDFWEQRDDSNDYGPNRQPQVKPVADPAAVEMRESGDSYAITSSNGGGGGPRKIEPVRPVRSTSHRKQQKRELASEKIVERAASVISKLQAVTAAAKSKLQGKPQNSNPQPKSATPESTPVEKERAGETNSLRDKIRGLSGK